MTVLITSVSAEFEWSVFYYFPCHTEKHWDFQFGKENDLKKLNCISFLDILLVHFVNSLVGEKNRHWYTLLKN